MEKEGSLSLNSEGVIIRFSSGFEEALGFRESEVKGKHFFELGPAELKDEFRALVENSRNSGPIAGHAIRMLRKGGGEIEKTISIYPLRDVFGVLHSFIVNLNAKNRTERLAFLSEEFQRIFSFSNDAVAITDLNGNMIDVNRAFLETYGYTLDEVLGQNPRILKSGHSTKELYERMWKDILDPKIGYWRGEIINVAKDGTEVPVLLSINGIKDREGNIRHFLGIAFNLTKQKELEKLNKLYINYVVHDLRGPLTTIMSNTELLLMKPEDAPNERGLKKLNTILSSVTRLNMMTSDILDYSKAQNKSLDLQKEKVSVERVLREAAAPFERLGKKFVVNGSPFGEWEGSNIIFTADHDKLQRIFYNILSNAFKHAASEVRVDFEVNESGLQVSISDNGKGIPPEYAGMVFEAFYQTPEGVRSGGAGLGLNIVKTFIDLHKGKVWIAPCEGPGTTIIFTIPS